MLPKTNHKLIIFIVIIPIAILLFLYLNWLWPLQNTVTQLESNVKIEKQQLEKLKTSVSSKDESAKNNASNVVELLPEKPATEQMVLVLKEAEAKTGSKIETIEKIDGQEQGVSTETEDTSGVQKLTYRLNVSAKDYQSLTTFISLIEQADRFIMVTSSSLDSDAGFSLNSGNLTAEITIEIYYLPTK